MTEETFWNLLFLKIAKKYGANLYKKEEQIIFDVTNDGNIEIIIEDNWILDVQVKFSYEDLTTIIEETDYFIRNLKDMKNIIKELEFYSSLLRNKVAKKLQINISSQLFDLFYLENVKEDKHILLRVTHSNEEIPWKFIYSLGRGELLPVKSKDVKTFSIEDFLNVILDIETLPLFEIIDYERYINFVDFEKLDFSGE